LIKYSWYFCLFEKGDELGDFGADVTGIIKSERLNTTCSAMNKLV
jgi:hypothetical protein